MKKKRAVVVCPGRGTYTKSELGYLEPHRPKSTAFLERLDQRLADIGEPTVSALDQAKTFSLRTHTPGEYASTLIYACSACDFFAIDRDQFDIVAVTGNSMGWYTALSLAGALGEGERGIDASFSLIHTMGSMMRDGIVGGQLIYPVVDEEWRLDPAKQDIVDRVMAAVADEDGCEVYDSINFGGYRILGGTPKALKRLMEELPPVDERYPFILVNHAAFHTPMLHAISEQAFRTLGEDLFTRPALPLIDGRGLVWQPSATDPARLRHYTLGHQVVETYDFSKAIEVALKEFAPDHLILLGPGATSGGAVGQCIVEHGWRGIRSKTDFVAKQASDPFVLAMGREDQRRLVQDKSRWA